MSFNSFVFYPMLIIFIIFSNVEAKSPSNTSGGGGPRQYGGSGGARPSSSYGATSTSYLYSTAYKNEIMASFSNATIETVGKVTMINASLDYKYMIMKAMQVGGRLQVSNISGSGFSVSCFGLWGNFTYNFTDTWNNSDSYFAGANLGMACTGMAGALLSYSSSTSSKFSWAFEGGKRFSLWKQIQYVPKAGVQKIGESDMGFFGVPLNISIMF